MEIFKIVILSLSGLLLFAVGTMRLSNPLKAYLKNSGIKLENDTDLLNEMRGVSAVMLMAGAMIILGIFVDQFTFTSFAIAVLLFIGFAIGRLISTRADGKPNKQIMQGLFSELVLGAANAFCLFNELL